MDGLAEAVIVQKDGRGLIRKAQGAIESTLVEAYAAIHDLDVIVDHRHAYSRYISDISGTLTSGKPFSFVTRVTDVWELINGQWLIVQEHSSAPPR